MLSLAEAFLDQAASDLEAYEHLAGSQLPACHRWQDYAVPAAFKFSLARELEARPGRDLLKAAKTLTRTPVPPAPGASDGSRRLSSTLAPRGGDLDGGGGGRRRRTGGRQPERPA